MRASSTFSSVWPDPNSPVLSKIDFGVPVVELLKWLDVRDTLLGENNRSQDIAAALALARDCKHPDAVWLTSISEGKDVSTKEKAREVFLCCENDARALCFASLLTGGDMSLLCRAAGLGCALACASLCPLVEKTERFFFSKQAASHHERNGFFWLGNCFSSGFGCEEDLNLAKKNYLIAAELGHVSAAAAFGDLLDVSDPGHWIWTSRVAKCDWSSTFLDSFANHVVQFLSGHGSARIVFAIGYSLKRNVDMEKREIFGSHPWTYDSLIGPISQAVRFYESQVRSARLAVDTWTLVGIRFKIGKDVRKLVGEKIWDSRFEANYDQLD